MNAMTRLITAEMKLKAVAGPLPLSQLTDAVRDPWLGIGPANGALIAVAAMAVAATAVAAYRAAL